MLKWGDVRWIWIIRKRRKEEKGISNIQHPIANVEVARCSMNLNSPKKRWRRKRNIEYPTAEFWMLKWGDVRWIWILWKQRKKNRNRDHVIAPSALLFAPSATLFAPRALLSSLHYSIFDIQRFNIQKYKPDAMPSAPRALLSLLHFSIFDIQRFNIQKYKPDAMPSAPRALLSLLHFSIFDILRFDIQKT